MNDESGSGRRDVNGGFRIGDWLVEPSLNTVSCNGLSRHLEPKVMAVLVCLAKAQNTVVSKQQLIEEVWKDTFVTDDVLTRCISELRDAFGDDARNPATIQTIPKQGYRLLLKVEDMNPGVAPASGLRRRWVMTAALVLALLIAAFALGPTSIRNRLLGRTSAPAIEAIAVLPLENLSGDPEQAYLADGMTEALINDLARTGTVTVIARNSIIRYQGTKKSLPEIARELHVDAIITGSVVRSGSHVRVTTQLIDARSEHSLWADRYDHEVQDIISMQDEFARAVVRQINGKLSPEQQQRLARVSPKVDPEAYDLYIKGRYHLNRRGHPGEVEKARDYFEQSLEVDAAYAPAYSGLADACLRLVWQGAPRQEGLALGKAAALKALELDDSLAEAHVSLAESKEFERDWAGADREHRRAIELNPNYAHGHHWYSQLLSELGRHDQAMAEIRRAYELDPLSPTTWTPGDALYMARRYDEAIAYARRMLELDPNEPSGYRILMFAYKAKGDLGRHMEAWSKYVLLKKFETPETVSAMMRLYARGGINATARATLLKAKKEDWDAEDLARIHVILGEHEQALHYLELSVEQGGGVWLKVDPYWDPVRADPRFQKLLRRMNFPDT
jgi:TolB-like protein/DNA-binding winged helix-turn-helix (wHTH) protein/Flp pilus assembly protein TadD